MKGNSPIELPFGEYLATTYVTPCLVVDAMPMWVVSPQTIFHGQQIVHHSTKGKIPYLGIVVMKTDVFTTIVDGPMPFIPPTFLQMPQPTCFAEWVLDINAAERGHTLSFGNCFG